MNAPANITHWAERVDLAAAFRWTVRLDMHEAVANHFSLAIDPAGARFLLNPDKRHFSRIRASDIIEVDANDPETLSRPGAPDATAWGLHGALHRRCPHVRCAMHIHAPYSTVLACLADPRLPPLDQNACAFFGPRQALDTGYGGLAFEEEGERCAALLADPRVKVLIMGNHGVMAVGRTVAETFDRMFYFERAAACYIRALQTGQPLAILSDAVAEKTAGELDGEADTGAEAHFSELKAILDAEGADYAT